MKNLVAYLIRQKLAVNLVALLIIAGGLAALHKLNREAYPEVNFDMVSIVTVYPGAAPVEMESLVTVPIEKKLREVDGIDKVRAYNTENVSSVVVFVDDKAGDKARVVQDIKDAVDSVTGLPDKAESPVVVEIKIDKSPLIDIGITATNPNVEYGTLKEVADLLEDFLFEINGVADVEKHGYREREFQVEVEPASLRRFRMDISKVAQDLDARNVNIPGGVLKLEDREVVLRTLGQYRAVDEIRNTVLRSNDAGYLTRVKDLAKVYDGFKEAEVVERVNGETAIRFKVFKKRSADEIDLAERLRKRLGEFPNPYPKQVELNLFEDVSEFTQERIDSVIDNAMTGFVLLAAILLVLLGWRLSAIVGVSIPMAIMVAFLGMQILDVMLNIISLFAMVMVLGMIVDFGIVVSENSYRYMERGMKRHEAVIRGVSEVFWPVTVTLLCITAAFGPLLFMGGMIGKFIVALPLVLILCLSASWFAAMFILPTHLDMFAKVAGGKSSDDENAPGFFGNIQRFYRKTMHNTLRHRYITLAVLLVMWGVAAFLAYLTGFVFMPGGGEKIMMVELELPQGANLEATTAEALKVEKILLTVPEEEMDTVKASIGEGLVNPMEGSGQKGSNLATLTLYLVDENDRKRSATAVRDELREKIEAAEKAGKFAEGTVIHLELQHNGPPVGKAVDVELRGDSFATMQKIAAEYLEHLKTIEGVVDPEINFKEGKREFRYTVDEGRAKRSGLSVRDVALALNASFQGQIATNVQVDNDDVDIRVRFPEAARHSKSSLDHVMVANQTGGLIPLNAVTKLEEAKGAALIKRLNYKRILQVQADVDTKTITSLEVNNQLKEKFADIEKRYPGYQVNYGGEDEETAERMGELGVLFLFALAIIYIVLAIFMDSLALPLVVMGAIPFSLVGVATALYIHGEPFSFMAVLGMFSLAGVIVSNTLVLVEFITLERKKGKRLKDALVDAGAIRLRPIILTSGTTVLGLFPTIYAGMKIFDVTLPGGRDYFVAPLSLAFGYGLIFATVITLGLIPCLYHIAEDIKTAVARVLWHFGVRINPSLYGGSVELPLPVVAASAAPGRAPRVRQAPKKASKKSRRK